VVLRIEKGGPWVYGTLVNYIWSLSSDEAGGSYNNLLMKPFLNYNFPGGVYAGTSPIITANWEAPGDQRWTLPLGAVVGKIFHFGTLPVKMQVGDYYNGVHPDNGTNWQIRTQVQFMFPK
jgi:hypothetical protein